MTSKGVILRPVALALRAFLLENELRVYRRCTGRKISPFDVICEMSHVKYEMIRSHMKALRAAAPAIHSQLTQPQTQTRTRT